MLTNDQMKPNRFLRWAAARKLVNRIQEHLENGGTVVLSTYTHSWQYRTPKHAAMFRATRTGALVQMGKRWDCIDYCAVRFY